jgi:hypothetical protein
MTVSRKTCPLSCHEPQISLQWLSSDPQVQRRYPFASQFSSDFLPLKWH